MMMAAAAAGVLEDEGMMTMDTDTDTDPGGGWSDER
jgi:hypothetical protein